MTTVSVLGHLIVTSPGQITPQLAPQSRRLLALLATHPSELLDRAWLAEGLWGNADAAHLRSLQVHISHLRASLGRALIESVDQRYRLGLDPAAVDEVRFRSLVIQGQSALSHAHYDDALSLLGEALDLWRGEPYADLACEFIRARRASLRELKCAAEEGYLRSRVEMIRTARDAEAVMPLAAQRMAEQPFREARIILHMRCLIAAGRLTDAVNAAIDYRRRLMDDVGVEPGPDFAEVVGRIMRRDASLMPEAWNSRCDVPQYSTPLLQRDAEHDVVVALLKWNSVRLVCLTGEPGVGKTRLAAAVAETISRGFPGGVIWLRPQDSRDPERALAHVANAIGMRASSAELRQRLPRQLGRSRTLVVLDGVETENVVPCVAVLLAAGSLVSVLVTGTHRLGLASAHEMRVHPMSREDSVALVQELVGIMGGASASVSPRSLSSARGLPLLLEHLAIDLVSARAST